MNPTTATIITAKENLGLSWEDIGAALEMSPVWTTSACLGMNSMPADKAQRLCELLKLDNDGIMSAIDFSMDIDKKEDPKGDRVVITLNGKFLPYRTW